MTYGVLSTQGGVWFWALGAQIWESAKDAQHPTDPLSYLDCPPLFASLFAPPSGPPSARGSTCASTRGSTHASTRVSTRASAACVPPVSLLYKKRDA